MLIKEISVLFEANVETSDLAEAILVKSEIHKYLTKTKEFKLEEVDYDDDGIWRAVYQ